MSRTTCCPRSVHRRRQRCTNCVARNGSAGEPDGKTGAEVEKCFRDGQIREIADYCESDVVNTYRVWLRYELFRGRLSDAEFLASDVDLIDFIKVRGNAKPHLAY